VRPAIRYGDGLIPIARGDVTEVLAKFRDMVREAGRDPASIEITSFGVEDLDPGEAPRRPGSGPRCGVVSVREGRLRYCRLWTGGTAIMRNING